MELIAILQRHVEDAKHDKKYFSPEIQNKFIQSLVSAVRKHILSRIKEASSYGFIVDGKLGSWRSIQKFSIFIVLNIALTQFLLTPASHQPNAEISLD